MAGKRKVTRKQPRRILSAGRRFRNFSEQNQARQSGTRPKRPSFLPRRSFPARRGAAEKKIGGTTEKPGLKNRARRTKSAYGGSAPYSHSAAVPPQTAAGAERIRAARNGRGFSDTAAATAPAATSPRTRRRRPRCGHGGRRSSQPRGDKTRGRSHGSGATRFRRNHRGKLHFSRIPYMIEQLYGQRKNQRDSA